MPISIEQLEECSRPLVRAWGDPVPAFDAEKRAVADQVLEGIVNFYDQPVVVGRRDVDWSGGHHNHQEWRAQLNRFYWLAAITSAYRETGDERYAQATHDLLSDWMRAHPSQPNWNKADYDNVLNLCIRMGNSAWLGWIGLLPVFMRSPLFNDEFVDQLVMSCRTQLNFLDENMSGTINWRIANADCLLSSGIRLSFLPEAQRWRERGLRILNDAWHRQVLPDGTHHERNPSYHTWMTRVMLNYWRLGQQMPELVLVMEPKRLGRMFDYALGCTAPNGSLNSMHDCHGERTGSHDSGIKAMRLKFLQEAGLIEPGAAGDDPDAALPPTSQYFPDAGQVFLRDGWNEDATYLAFDATQWGGGHCHLSRNSVMLHANGRALLVDPGSLTYEASDPFAAHGKSTRAHNTLSINGWNQGECNPMQVQVMHGDNYDFVSSEYDGPYWSGRYTWTFDQGRGHAAYATHHRMLLWLRGRFAIVCDSLHREPSAIPEVDSPSVEANWQLCEGGKVTIEEGGARAVAQYGDSNLLMLFPLRWPDLQVSLHEGDENPLRGWLPQTMKMVPAPQIVVGKEVWSERFLELATVLLPYTTAEPPRVECTAHKTDGQKPAYLNLRWPDGSSDEFWWTHRGIIMLERIGEIETDGGLLHVRKSAEGAIVHGCAVGATYMRGPVNSAMKLPLPTPGLIEFW